MSGLGLGLLVLVFLGDGLFRLLERAGLYRSPQGAPEPLSSPERIGLRALFALAAVPWVCLILDQVRIPIGKVSLALAALLVEAAGLWWGRRGALRDRVPAHAGLEGVSKRPDVSGDGQVRPSAPVGGWLRWIARFPAAALLAAATASLVVFSAVHVSLVPVRTYDALVGYDLVGRVLAYEGKLVSSIFSKLYFNAQCVYPPFTATNDGFWYIFHPPVPELWVPLLTAGFVLTVWGRTRRWTGSPTAAGLATFVMLLPTSLAFQLTVGQTDLPSMVFLTLALFSMVEFLRGRLGVSQTAVYALLASTGRAENALMAGALALVGLLRMPQRRWKSLWILAGPAAFFVFWNLYVVKVRMGYNPAAHFRSGLDLDPGRAWEVLRRAGEIVARPENFGELVWLVLALPPLWWLGRRGIKAGRWKGTSEFDLTGTVLLLLAALFVSYLPYFYMWDPSLNPLWTMEHTFKRGFFRFIPGILVAFVASPPVLWFLRRCDGPPSSR